MTGRSIWRRQLYEKLSYFKNLTGVASCHLVLYCSYCIFAVTTTNIWTKCTRERAAEVEKDIERQRLLEIERAKTRELRQNLEMEKERQTQVMP